MKTGAILYGLIILLLGVMIGLGIGMYLGVDFCTRAGIKFLEAKNISLDINETNILQAVQQYHYAIGR